MTKFISFFQRKTSRKLSVLLILLGTSFFYSSTANAVSTGQVTITCAKTTGEEQTFNVGWDNSNIYFEGKGDIARLFCEGGHAPDSHTVFVSTSVTDLSLRYYNGVLPAPSAPQETQTVVSSQDTQTVVDSQTSVSDTSSVVAPTPETQTATSDTSTVVQDTQTVVVESQTSTTQVDTPTSVVVDTQTSLSDTATSIQTNPQQTPVDTVVPSPTPEPIRPEPVVVVPEPQPVPQPELIVEPEIIVEPVVEEPLVEEPVEDLIPLEDTQSEEVSVEENSESEELPVDSVAVEESIDSSDNVLDQPSVLTEEPAPVLPVESPQPPLVSEPMVTLDNGVILAEEVVVALAILENPTELLAEIFTDPGQVLLALSNIGADMSPEVREKSEKVVISAVIAGNIATQAAATAGAVAAYRRKP